MKRLFKNLFLIITFMFINSSICFAGWKTIGSDWYYEVDGTEMARLSEEDKAAVDPNTNLCLGQWWHIKGGYFAFDSSGKMRKGETIDGIELDASSGWALKDGQKYTTPPGGTTSSAGWDITKVMDNVRSTYLSNGVYDLGKSKKWNINGIDASFNTDCTGFTSACIYYYYILSKGKTPLSQDIITNQMRHATETGANASNMNKPYFSRQKISSPMQLRTGDILWYYGHAIMCYKVNQSSIKFYHWTNNPKINSSFETTMNNLSVSNGMLKIINSPEHSNLASGKEFYIERINNSWPY